MLIKGAMNGEIFLAYLEQCLAPTLRRGDIVVIDNLPAHRVVGVEEVIQGAGASLRYLPQYSPDLNPIEMVYHPLKAFLRKVAERTIAGLSRRIGSFDQIELAEGERTFAVPLEPSKWTSVYAARGAPRRSPTPWRSG